MRRQTDGANFPLFKVACIFPGSRLANSGKANYKGDNGNFVGSLLLTLTK